MNRQASVQAQCLLNNPMISASTIDVTAQYPGQFLSPSDQCKMLNGNESSFCAVCIPLFF